MDASDPCVDGVGLLVGVREGFASNLARVIAGAGAIRVDVREEALVLGVLDRLAVDLTRRRDEHTSTISIPARELKDLARPPKARFEGADGIALVDWRGSGAREMVDTIEVPSETI